MATPLGGGSLFRFGVFGLDANHRRWLVTETWYSTFNLTHTQVSNVSASICGWLQRPFGTGTGYDNYAGSGHIIYRIYPNSWAGPGLRHLLTPGFGPSLNTAASEAAYRLQRVGAGGAAGPKGRMCYPILSDAAYADLPHRRHVRQEELQQALDDGWASRPLDYGAPYGNLRPVIFHRKTMSVTEVTNYVIQPNPVRLWQRWRYYPTPPRTTADDQQWDPPLPWLT